MDLVINEYKCILYCLSMIKAIAQSGQEESDRRHLAPLTRR
ncbi:hypothetical protein [Nostoc sp. CENA543]|nr:hypothetical protein [Nostoc sp. CENA543]